MRPPLRAVALLAATAALVAGCSSADDWTQPHPKPIAIGALGPGFVDPSAPPAPEGTVRPQPGSWTGVHPPKDYRVVLLTAGDDRPTKALVTAVQDWAEDEHVDLRTVVPDGPHDLVPSITRALKMGPDLIVSAGNDLIDPLATVTPSHLSQQFLVVGAESGVGHRLIQAARHRQNAVMANAVSTIGPTRLRNGTANAGSSASSAGNLALMRARKQLSFVLSMCLHR